MKGLTFVRVTKGGKGVSLNKIFLGKQSSEKKFRKVFDLEIITSMLQGHAGLLLFYAGSFDCIKIGMVLRPQSRTEDFPLRF